VVSAETERSGARSMLNNGVDETASRHHPARVREEVEKKVTE